MVSRSPSSIHEFVPHQLATQKELAEEMGMSIDEVKLACDALEEFNPMLGHRGCRLGCTYPEITEMQARAIIEAALNVKAKGIDVHPEIMVPLVVQRIYFLRELRQCHVRRR